MGIRPYQYTLILWSSTLITGQPLLALQQEQKQQSNNENRLLMESLHTLIESYRRPITVLELTSRPSFCSLVCARNHPRSTFVIASNDATIITRAYSNNAFDTAPDNSIVLQKALSFYELTRLSECEHFDIIIARSVCEHYGENWAPALHRLCAMSSHVLIENSAPYADSTQPAQARIRKSIDLYLRKSLEKTPKNMAYDRDRSVYLLSNDRYQMIERKTYLWNEKFPIGSHMIRSTPSEKELIKHKQSGRSSRPWLPGINFFTFKMLQGTLPTKKSLKTSLKKFMDAEDSTITINKLLLQGASIAILPRSYDNENLECPGSCTFFFDKHLEEMLNIVDIDDPEELQKLFIFRGRLPLA